MKKKIILIILILFLIVTAAIATPFLSLINIEKYESHLTIDKDTNTLQMTGNDEIKILQLSDIQVKSFSDAIDPCRKIKKLIKQTNPDLIVITGDNLSNGGTQDHVETMTRFMDSFEIPWAIVLGNHDHQAKVSIDKQSEIYESSKFGLFKSGDIEESKGNYYYTIKRNNEAIYSLIFMDSKREGFTMEHKMWYENTINKINDENNKTVPNMLFYHIPLPETIDAYNAYTTDNSIGSGIANEIIYPQTTDIGFFDKVIELGSTNFMAFGHDHVNTLHIKYQNVMFCYGLKTGFTSYYDESIQGGCLYTINTYNEILIERIFI